MNDNSKQLKNPPVVIALVQLKFSKQNFKIDEVLQFNERIMRYFPIRQNNIQVGLNLGKTTIPLGESKVSGVSNAEVNSYIYLTKDQKTKLGISTDTITYIDENKYNGWENFKKNVLQMLNILSPILIGADIHRISIRFVNRFTFDEFLNPSKYFTALITSPRGETLYPLHQYGFRLIMDVPNTDIYTIVNHNVENIASKYVYTLDIDVLDHQKLIFDMNTIGESLENLRSIKNNVFFNTITDDTINICNSQQ